MRVLVMGGTGTVGSQVARALRDHGAAVRVLTRSAAKLGTLPAGVEGIVADLGRPRSLPPAFAGVSRAFLATAQAPSEVAEGRAAIAAAVAAGVERLVYVSLAAVEAWPDIPIVAAKRAIEAAVRSSGISYTVLRPSNYFQNDLALKPAIVQYGMYPQPIGSVGVSRVDVRDVADAAVTALLNGGHDAATYTLFGPDELTGNEVARVYTRHLGRQVVYGGDDLDAWAARVSTALPPWLVGDLRIMFGHLQRRGLLATDGDLAVTRKVVGHAPRTFEEFVAGLAPAWRA